jgi:hypothetical protein
MGLFMEKKSTCPIKEQLMGYAKTLEISLKEIRAEMGKKKGGI